MTVKQLLDRAAGGDFQLINGVYYFSEDFVTRMLEELYGLAG